MCMERRKLSQIISSEWQTVFVVFHKMPWCALLTTGKNYNKSLEKLQDFFFKTETKTKTKCSRPRPRPRLHDRRPRLSFLSSRRHRYQNPVLEDFITVTSVSGLFAPWALRPMDVSLHRRFGIIRPRDDSPQRRFAQRTLLI